MVRKAMHVQVEVGIRYYWWSMLSGSFFGGWLGEDDCQQTLYSKWYKVMEQNEGTILLKSQLNITANATLHLLFGIPV